MDAKVTVDYDAGLGMHDRALTLGKLMTLLVRMRHHVQPLL